MTLNVDTDKKSMDVAIYGLIRSGTTMVADLLTARDQSLIISEPDLFVKWHDRTANRIDDLLRAFGLSVPERPDQQVHGSYTAYFEEVIVPELGNLDLWGIKQVNFLGWRKTLDRYRPNKLVLCVRDIRDVVLSALDLIIWEKPVFPGRRYLRDEAWILARLCHDVFELMALQERPHFLARYEDLVSDAGVQDSLREFVGLDELGSERLNLELESGRNRLESGKHGTGISNKSVGRYHNEPPGPAKALAQYVWRMLPEYSRAFGYETPDNEKTISHPFTNLGEHDANPVQWKMFDTWNWNGPDAFDPAFARRRARLTVSANIKPGTGILDIGSTLPVFHYLLNEKHDCQFVDTTNRIPDALAAQWMAGELPPVNDANLVTVIGALEFIEDLQSFMQQLRELRIPAMVSYHLVDDAPDIDRIALGWRNHLDGDDFVGLLEDSGFKFTDLRKFDGRQSLYLLT